MAKYVIEIGISSLASPRPDGTYPYLMSFVKADWENPKVPGTPAWFTQPQVNDKFVFRVFDYTHLGGTPTPQFQVNGLFIRFLNPANPQAAASVVSEDMICTGKDYYPVKGATSYVVKHAPGWYFGKKGKEKHFSFDAGNQRALLQANVAATAPIPNGPAELRWYTHDPEIFVGEGGHPIHQPPGPSVPKRR